MPAAHQTIEIDCAPEAVMSVIIDFASYPTFLHDMARVEVLRADAASWDVRFHLNLIRRLTYVLRLTRTSPLELTWSLVEGAFRANDGGWKLEPLDEGRRTRATYSIDLQVGMFVPGNIVHSLVDRALPDTLRCFKEEAERRRSAG